MSRSERVTRKEPLPPGNIWRFSDRNNDFLNPKHFATEHTDLSQMPQALQRVVATIQGLCVEGWEFAAVLEHYWDDNEDSKKLAIIFTNPAGKIVSGRREWLSPWGNFVKKNDKQLRTDKINASLEGTNYMVDYVQVQYNNLSKRLLSSPFMASYVYQTGVAAFELGLKQLKKREMESPYTQNPEPLFSQQIICVGSIGTDRVK